MARQGQLVTAAFFIFIVVVVVFCFLGMPPKQAGQILAGLMWVILVAGCVGATLYHVMR